MSGTRRFWFGNGSLDAIRCYVGLDSVLNRPWIVRSVDICPIHNRSKTDKPSTIGGRIETETLPSAPPKKPTPHRHRTDRQPTVCRGEIFQTCLKDFSRQICLPKHKPTPNRQNRINTDCKPISPLIWWFLSVWSRFRVGLDGVTEV